MKKRIYLDHNATTPLHPEVKKAIERSFGDFGNPSSLHYEGRRAGAAVERARASIAAFIGASPEELIFTGSGSEANNTVLSMFVCPAMSGAYHTADSSPVVTTSIEHPCILETARCLEDRGTKVLYIDVDRFGKIKKEELKKALDTKNTGIVSVMMANNEIGTIQDIKEIGKMVHEKGALFHTDAVQAVGKVPVDVGKLGVDFLTLSAHKIYGPKGVGAIYVKKGIPFCPLIRGGHQEKGRRAGTENTLGIIAFGEAVRMRKKEMPAEEKRLAGFKEMLKKGISDEIPDIQFNGHPRDSLSSTLNVSFRGAEGEATLLYLDMEGIAVSTGSACASGSLDPSHVLLAAGLPAEEAHGSIRISMGRGTTLEEIKYVLKVLPKVIAKVRGMSTAYSK